MPNVDTSDYTRRLKLRSIGLGVANGNINKRKALTVFDTYNPYIPHLVPTGGGSGQANGRVSADICTLCFPLPDKNDTFAAKKYAASRVPHFN
jgi:hypothetical protein